MYFVVFFGLISTAIPSHSFAIMKYFFYMIVVALCSCGAGKPKGFIERLDTSLDAIIESNATVEVIADGFNWCEGPLWIEAQQMLLFSDVPENKIYKWTDEKGKELYLQPSGFTGNTQRGGETGSNGLLLGSNGQLILCQHGNRQIAVMDAPLASPLPQFRTLAATYDNKKFNSPNDLVQRSNGDVIFTDPPYGLEKNMDDPLKEIPFQGVYLVKPSGKVILISDSISRPNGLALTPDEKTLFVANSDPDKPVWYTFQMLENDSVSKPTIFYNALSESKSAQGLPDGMKIDSNGNIFATGPGGVFIFNKAGKLLGKIRFDGLTSNCAFSADEKTLFITADDYLLRVKMR